MATIVSEADQIGACPATKAVSELLAIERASAQFGKFMVKSSLAIVATLLCGTAIFIASVAADQAGSSAEQAA